MTGWSVAIYLFSNVLMAWVVCQFMQMFFGQKAENRWKAGSCYTIYVLGISVVYLLWNKPALTLVVNLVLIFIIAANYSGSWIERTAATFFVYIAFLICESFVAVVLAACDKVWFDGFNEEELLLTQVMIPVATFILIRCIGRLRILQGHEQIQLTAWLAVLLVPACTALPILTIVVNGEPQKAPVILLCILELLAINILVFYLYNKIAQLYQEKLESQMMLQQQKAYQQQAELFRQKQEEMQNLRHDLQHHITALQTYCQQDHNEKALEYVERLKQTVQWPDEYVLTGLNALDAIVNYKLTMAQQAGVLVDKMIQVPTTLQYITDDDLCAVLGNLLDNALRAASDLPAEQRHITLQITYQQDSLTIIVINPYKGALRKQNGRFLTTKTERGQHGIGLRSVSRIADKYNGELTVTEEEQLFTVYIWLSDYDWEMHN